MEAREIEAELDEIESRIERLRALYEQYFMGLEKIEPQIPRKDVDRRIWAMRKEHIRNTGLRFKFQMLFQRYNTFQQYWGRITREIENGTYRRDVMRAAKRFGEKEALTIVGKKRAEQFKLLAAAQKKKDEAGQPEGPTRQEEPGRQDEPSRQEEPIRQPAGMDALAAASRGSHEFDDDDDDDAPTPPAHRVAPAHAMAADYGESSPVSTRRDPMAIDYGESSAASTQRDPVDLYRDDAGPVSTPRGPMAAHSGETGSIPRRPGMSPGMAPPPPNARDGRPPSPAVPPAPIAPSLDLRWGPPPAAASKPIEKGKPAEKSKVGDTGDVDVKKRVAALAAQLKTHRGDVADAGAPPAGLDLDLDLEPTSRRRKSAMPSRRPTTGRMKSVRVPPLPLPPDLLSEPSPMSAPQPSSRRARPKESGLLTAPKTGPKSRPPVATSGPKSRPPVAGTGPRSRPPPAISSPGAGLSTGRAPASTPIGGIPLTRRVQMVPASSTPAPVSRPSTKPPRAPAGDAASQDAASRDTAARAATAAREAASRAAAREAAARSAGVERQPSPPARVEDDAGLPDQRLRQIYSKYVDTRRASNESTAGLTYEKLAASLRAQAIKLKATHSKKNVDYDVIVKDGKTVLKPILR